MFEIVIPHMNGPRLNVLAIACLRSIRAHSKDFRILWVQNGGQVPPGIKSELLRCEDHKIIANLTNIGFVRATNQGMKASTAPYVVLMNNDTEAAVGWLDKLRTPLLDGYAITGPLSGAAGSWQGRWTACQGVIEVPRDKQLAFFCTMIKREVIDKIGYLDEGYGFGLGDDDDYILRARQAGFKIGLVQDLVIAHRHRSTFRTLFSVPQIHKIQQAAVARLKLKGLL